MLIDLAALDERTTYKLLTGLIVPRPIAWVSTLSIDGIANLAPFSYFTIASTAPPMLVFCPARTPSGEPKDTLRNIEARPEFVIHSVTEEWTAAMNQTAATLPHGVSEFDQAGLTMLAAHGVAPPLIAGVPVAFECRLEQLVRLPTSEMVVGRVLAVHVEASIYHDGRILMDAYHPVGRLAGQQYVRCGDSFSLERPH